MLRYEDNPGLFCAIWQQYGEKLRGTVAGFATPKPGYFFSDDELAQVTELKIVRQYDFTQPIKTLNGIDQLDNLKKFEYVGYVASNLYGQTSGVIERSNYLGSEATEKDKQYMAKIINNSQLEDISALQRCFNLESVILRNQNNITEVDFSGNPKLHHIELTNCRYLKTVKGLDELLAVKYPEEAMIVMEEDPYNDMEINFNGCYSLREIENFDSFVNSWYNNNEIPVDVNAKLPTTLYCNLTRKYPQGVIELLEHNRQEHDFIQWTDVGNGDVLYSVNTKQMQMAKERVDNIVRTVCDENDSPIVRVSKVYRWICDNVTYDHDQIQREHSGQEKVDWTHYKGHENRYGRNISRSAYRALFDKKAVCVGVSNLFNFMCSDIGYLALPCSCAAAQNGDPRLALSDHQMSKMIINGNLYYFDPTWDLGKERSGYFGLSKQEIEGKWHTLTIDDVDVENAESIQRDLYNARCLETQKQDSNIINQDRYKQ